MKSSRKINSLLLYGLFVIFALSSASLALLSGGVIQPFTSSAASVQQGNVCQWNGSTGDWNDASRWSCSVVPGASDTAVINGGNPIISSDTTVGTLQFANGTLTCNATLTISSAATFSGSINLGGAGGVVNNGTLTINSNGLSLTCLLTNNGTVNWAGGTIQMSNGARILNQAGANFNIQTDAMMAPAGGLFENAGVVTKSVGSSTIQEFYPKFINTGTLNVNAGTLQFTDVLGLPGGTTNNGAYNVAAGAKLRFAIGTHTTGASGSVNGAGEVLFDSGTMNINGLFNVTGTVTVAGGATVNFNTPTSITTLNLFGGFLEGSGDITILSSMNWTGGALRGSGLLNIAANATANLNASSFSLARTISNRGVMNWINGTIEASNPAAINNQSEGTLNLLVNNGSLLRGDGVINNAGKVLRRNAQGGLPPSIRVPFNNTGILEITSAALDFRADSAGIIFGTVNQTAGTTILNNGTLIGNLAINGGTLTGIGTITENVTNAGLVAPGLADNLPGTITINRNYTQTATGRLDMEFGSTSPGVNSDLLSTSTTQSTSTTLGGTLDISFLSGFRPPASVTLQVMRYGARNGAFATINGLDLGGGQVLSAEYRTIELVLVSGDGGPGVPWVEVVPTQQKIRGDRGTEMFFGYTIKIGNSGGQAMPVVGVIETPPTPPLGPLNPPVPVKDEIEDLMSNDPVIPIDDPQDRIRFNDLPKKFPRPDGSSVIPFVINLPPGSNFEFEGGFNNGVPKVVCPGGLLGSDPMPLVKIVGNDATPSDECIASLVDFAISAALELIPGGDCITVLKAAAKAFLQKEAVAIPITGKPASLASVLVSMLLDASKAAAAAAECGLDFFPVSAAFKAVIDILDLLSKGSDVLEILANCSGSVLPNPLLPTNELRSTASTDCVTSKDPNDKVGPAGTGGARFLTGSEPLRYTVFFENVPDATAPAQIVSIRDQLDPALLNFNTFALGSISFADKRVIPPPNSTSFTTDVDLRPAKNLLVRINASLDQSTGLLTWLLTSIDPATGQPIPPTSVDGFLDPNVNRPEGEGSVAFVVQPKTALPSGTVIRNKARIIFDDNDPIDTPEWFNTIDNSRPASQVLALASSQCSSFRVQWSGTDDNSGVATYSIFFSKDGGPVEPWLQHTNKTSEFFNGVAGSTYSFYSVARDLAGNVEDAPAQPDATTTVTNAMAITPATQSFNAQGGNNTVNVLAPGGCDWIAVSNTFFIHVAAGTSGNGNGTVTYSVDPNPTDEARRGAIVIAGNRFIIDQAAGPATGNQSPTAIDDTATTNQNTPVNINVLANDSDPDGDTLIITSISQAGNGTLALNANNTVTYSPNTGFTGTDSFTYTVSDGRGGTDTAAVALTVTLSNQAPIAVCQNITSAVGPNCQTVVTAQDVGGASSDPDGDAITLTLSPAGPFTVGTHLVTLTVTDSHGASASCDATVTVTDTTPPVVVCPSNIVASAASGQCSAIVNYPATATDNCSGATVTCSPSSGSSFNAGITTVICVASDATGNTANCSFSVIVNDAQLPTISCPANVSATAQPGSNSAVVSYSSPQITDNCPGATVVCVPPSGSTFPTGVTTVSCTATDAASNSAQCSFTVTVSAAPAQADRIAFESSRDGNFEIYSMNADGTNPTRLTSNSHSDFNPAWSPDRTKIAFTSTRDGNAEIYVMNADGTGQTRLTSTSAVEDDPSWSPDGTRIAFWSTRNGNPEIYVMNANGTGQTRVTSNSRSDTQPRWSPDGAKIVFVSNRNNLINFDIYVMNADGSNVTRLTTNLSIDESPAWSPDGTKIVFTSNRSNLLDFEIWVMNANGSNQTRLTTSTRSNVRACWSRDGSHITFATNRHSLLNFEIYKMKADGTSQTRITTNSAVDFNPDW